MIINTVSPVKRFRDVAYLLAYSQFHPTEIPWILRHFRPGVFSA
jgi:hypothetical protein